MRLIIIGAEVGNNSTIKIEEKVEQYGIRDKVLLPGTQYDIKMAEVQWIYLFSHHFRGLPLSVVEAQANGLLIVVSDTITKELDILESNLFVIRESN